MKNRNQILLILSMGISFCVSFAQGSSITGKVSFEGEAPKPKPLSFGAEKQCADMHKDHPPMAEDLVVNPDHTVKWALVYVKGDVKGDFKAPEASFLMDQKGCVFAPHVAAVMAGQKVSFLNSDPVLHNVRTNSKINTPFNIAEPFQGISIDQVFDKPELAIEIRCDVHFWMKSFIHIFSHPYFAVTGDDGSFVIKDLPAGNYTLEVWHEKLGTQTQEVTVADTDTKEVGFTLKKPS